jgi:lysophosphatidic acid acyltransferase/lysophosphatidylinositol acyltransferase
MGWAWMFAESIFLERNWEKDKQTIGRQIQELVEHPDPIWVSFNITVLHWFTVT